MLTLLVGLALCGLIGFALFSSTRGGGDAVSEADLGGINSYEAYYGKNRFSYGEGLPCERCVREGCIGAGQCRCTCHKRKK